MHDHHTVVAEIASATAILAYFTGVLPAVATLLAILWYLICIWDSNLVRRMTGRVEVHAVTMEVTNDRNPSNPTDHL
jgi:hypothetical protein